MKILHSLWIRAVQKYFGSCFALNRTIQKLPSSFFSVLDNSSNSIRGSFRRLSITERLQDPQTAIVQDPPPSSVSSASELHIKPKPRPPANPLLFERQVLAHDFY